MAVMRKCILDYLFLTLALFFLSCQPALSTGESLKKTTPEPVSNPSVYECRGHIEKALKEFITHQSPAEVAHPPAAAQHSGEDDDTHEDVTTSKEEPSSKEDQESGEDHASAESGSGEDKDDTSEESSEHGDKESADDEDSKESQEVAGDKDDSKESHEVAEEKDASTESEETSGDKDDDETQSKETEGEQASDEDDTSGENVETTEGDESKEEGSAEDDTEEESREAKEGETEDSKEDDDDEGTAEKDDDESDEKQDAEDKGSSEEAAAAVAAGEDESEEGESKSDEKGDESGEDESGEDESGEDESGEAETREDKESREGVTAEDKESGEDTAEDKESGDESKESSESKESAEDKESAEGESVEGGESAEKESAEDEDKEAKSGETAASGEDESAESGESEPEPEEGSEETEEEEEEEETEPIELRSHLHVEEILGLDDESMETTIAAEKSVQNTLKELKKMYDQAVKPMELLYKFKDISNRFVGDAEIFSKPMILFIGPWSSGKSTMINYLLDIEDTRAAMKTGAEPQSNGFTVLMYGDTEQTVDGIELAADWTFSTLQKFGQSFLDGLQGRKLPNNLLRKVTIVDTPGIMENRKQQERTFPFNDACQWLIDRADIIYVVFDPTKLDMGLEMEALFDQLKGREAQVRVILNKADSVSPQELMQVQSTLLWNLSPLLGSSEPPTIFVGTLWSRQYLPGSPGTLFDAQEAALLQDLRQTLDGRVENKISFTRRHAVRVRNHAKMVDCYLNTYYNHKTFFSNKKKVADEIIDNPQNYHIYEGLSTLTNVSRYDLPDPDIYRDFFKVNPLYDFKLLTSTCSYFKGCPLDKLDLAIAYDLPELMGKYRKLVGGSNIGKR